MLCRFYIWLFILDTILVVRLRETLDEKQKKLKSMLSSNQNDMKKLEMKEKENNEAIQKVTKMVIANG